MKKLLLFATLFLAIAFKAQSLDHEATKLSELMKLGTLTTKESTQDSVIVEMKKLVDNSTNATIKTYGKQAISSLTELKNLSKNVVSSKQISDLSKDDLKGYKIEDDKFRSITFITPNKFGTSKYAYLSIKEGVLNMRIVMEHYGSNWIFFDKVIILYSGKKIEYNSGKTQTYVGKGYVTETSDVKCSPEMISAFREIVNTEKVDIRLSGENKVNDFEMSDKTKKNIKQALDLYDKLKK